MPLGLARAASYCARRTGPSRSSLAWTSGSCDAITSANRLIGQHLRAGRVDAVREVFDRMPQRDVVSWNSLMAAYARSGVHDSAVTTFLEMRREGFCVDHTSFSTVLSTCARMEALALGRCIHGLATKTRSSLNVFVGASLITMYANCGVFSCLELIVDDVDSPSVALWNALISGLVMNHRVEDARRVFDQMPERSVVSWTVMIKGHFTVHEVGWALELFNLMPAKNSVSWCVMIGGLVSHKRFREVIELFNTLMSSRDAVTNAILVKIVNAYAGLKSIGGGRCVHGFAVKSGFIHDHIIDSSLVVMYCNSLDIDEAQLEFYKMEREHVGSWNAIISGCIHAGKMDEATKIFYSMDGRDKISWNLMVNGYVKYGKIPDAIELYSKMPEKNLEASTTLMSCFIDNGMLDKARDVFYSMPQVDVISCTTLWICERRVYIYDALDLFCRMHKRTVVDPDDIMFLGILSACNYMSLLEEGKHFFSMMTCNYGILPNKMHYACMVDLFGRTGMLEQAEELVKSMPFEPDYAIWTSLLSSCRLNGNDRLAEHAASQLISINPTTKMPYLHLITVNASTKRWSVMDNLRSQIRNAAAEEEVGYSWI